MKKRTGCGCLVIVFAILILTVVFFGGGENGNVTPTATKAAVTASPTLAVTKQPTVKPTSTPTAEPTEEPLVIYLRYPELGEYGRHYTFNATVEKATAADKETIIQCFVPSGRYTITNIGKYPTFVFVYGKETRISDLGWEEPIETWVSEMLKVGDSCEITVKEGHYINLQQNDTFKLVEIK